MIKKRLFMLSVCLLILAALTTSVFAFSGQERKKGFITFYTGYDFAHFSNENDLVSYEPLHLLNVGIWAGWEFITYNITYRTDRSMVQGSGFGYNEDTDFITNRMFFSLGDSYRDGIMLFYTYANFAKRSKGDFWDSLEEDTNGKYKIYDNFKYSTYGLGFKATELAMFFMWLFYYMSDGPDHYLEEFEEILNRSSGIEGYFTYNITTLPNPGSNKENIYHMFGLHFTTFPPTSAWYFNLELGADMGFLNDNPDIGVWAFDIEIGMGYRSKMLGGKLSFVMSVYDFGKYSDIEDDDDKMKVGDGFIDAMFIGLKAEINFTL
ncbi:hypothetical protein ACFL20_00495 [Spirochaetota bacterium]